MEIPLPTDIKLNAVSLSLIEDAASLARQVKKVRPLSEDVVENIQKELLSERVYNSNAIEGNTLTLRETESILNSGAKLDVGRHREATEAINLGKAIGEVQSLVPIRKAWSDFDQLLSVHGTLMKGVKDNIAGAIRSERVRITGAKHQPPRPELIRDLLDQFLEVLESSIGVEPILLATWTHWALARIHPFIDGNGRMARLWQDLVLFGNGLTAAVIRQQDRNEYYQALTQADDGDFNALVQLVSASLSKTLQIYVNAQRENDDLKNWAVDLVGESEVRVAEGQKLQYMRWVQKMEALRDAFERCAIQLTTASNGTVEVQVDSFEIINQSTWEALRSGDRAARTWFFWTHFRRGEKRIEYCFFFERHFSGPEDVGQNIGSNVCLLISEQQSSDKPVLLSKLDDCLISLREVLVVNNELSRKRYDGVEDSHHYDFDADPITIAREFMQEVLLSRIG